MTLIKKGLFSLTSKTTTTTTKLSRVVFALVAAVAVVSVGYIVTLAVLAPEQLAEATTAATDLVCDQCVGTTDIANGAVTSGKIANGQVKNADIGGNAVTTAKIADGQVSSSDIADVTIGSSDLADSAVTSSKLAGGAVKPNVHRVAGDVLTIAPGNNGADIVDCPAGEIVTGGGFATGVKLRILNSYPADADSWAVAGFNEDTISRNFRAFALCIGPSP